jgi:hypothetical protein
LKPELAMSHRRNPQYFPAYAQACCRFAQVIHKPVHRKVDQRPSLGAATVDRHAIVGMITRRPPSGAIHPWVPARRPRH